MDKQERIVCAAIRFAIPKEDYTGVKIVTGVDYESIVNDGVLGYLTHGEMTNIWQNGFITNKNRFVDAIEAMEIAVKSGQYPEKSDETLTCEITLGAVLRLPKSNRCRRKENVKGWISRLRYSRKQDDLRELKPEDLY